MTIRKIISIVFGIFLILLGIVFSDILPVNRSDYEKSDSELLTLTSYLSNNPGILQSGGKTSGKYAFRLDLGAYSGIHFDNENEFLDATDYKTFLLKAKFQDTITLKVDKNNFTKYYLNRNLLSTFQQLGHPQDNFPFYSLVFKNKEYVGDIYKAREKKRNNSIILNSIFGILGLVGGIYFIFSKKAIN